MKKILIFLFMIMCLCGCGCNKQTTNTPKGEVAKLFSNYNSLNSDVLIQLDSVMSTEDLTDSEKAKYKDVLKREKISAPFLGGGVALPHGMANLVIKPAVVIMKCAQRTEWQDGCVDIVFLLALNFEDIQSTRAFFSSFYEMTMEKNTTFLIRKAETEEEIMNVIMNSMNETEE